ncbi:MAG: hypothetical protein LBD84_03890 [Campylobacteraceae bacterium]|jgi:hypothetical protein|nr:hypothetical protein [Campylobacteraceae bacterium]
MKNIFLHVITLATMLFFSGCTSKYMQSVNLSKADMELSKNESAIVFFRPTYFGGGVQAPIAEFMDNDLKFVAIVSAKSKVFYKTTPGKHFFVVGGENGNLLEADFEGGKTYYSYIEPRFGFLKARFVFEPVKNSKIPVRDLQSCKWIASKPNESAVWFDNSKKSMQRKYENAFEKHQKTNPANQKIIKSEYGH